MGSYQTIVAGTDGSESALRAVDRAGALAGRSGARLVVACAYFPDEPDRGLEHAKDVLGSESYQVVRSFPPWSAPGPRPIGRERQVLAMS